MSVGWVVKTEFSYWRYSLFARSGQDAVTFEPQAMVQFQNPLVFRLSESCATKCILCLVALNPNTKVLDIPQGRL